MRKLPLPCAHPSSPITSTSTASMRVSSSTSISIAIRPALPANSSGAWAVTCTAASLPLARILARAAPAARGIAAAEVELLGEALLDEIVDRGVERVQAAQLFALELGV